MRTRRSSADRTAVITTIHTAHNGLSVRLANMTIPRRGAAPWSVASEFATDATVSSKTSARRVGCSGYTRIAPVRSSAGRVFAFCRLIAIKENPKENPKRGGSCLRTRLGQAARPGTRRRRATPSREALATQHFHRDRGLTLRWPAGHSPRCRST